jgi:hypothetical protein
MSPAQLQMCCAVAELIRIEYKGTLDSQFPLEALMVRRQPIITLSVLAGFVGFLSLIAFAQSPEKENLDVWAQAEAKIQTHLQGIAPKMRSVHLKSERLTKYLPEFRAFGGFDQKGEGVPRLLLVNQDAEITDLADENWQGEANAKYLRVPRVTEFLRARKIKVKTREDAIEFVKFVEGLQGAPSYVATLDVNTEDLTGFDRLFVEGQYSPRANWKYSSEKQEQGWKVTVNWVGNQATSILSPPIYEMEIDEHGNFRDLKRYDSVRR